VVDAALTLPGTNNPLRLPWQIKSRVSGYISRTIHVILDCHDKFIAECEDFEVAQSIVTAMNRDRRMELAPAPCKCRASKAGPGLVEIRKVSLRKDHE